MEFFAFNLMPWPHLPDDFTGGAWIDPPNELFDPVKGCTVYNNYLDQLELAEPLGFDGVVVNEHHQNAYGLMPSPNLFAAMLARRTERIKIAVVGNALPFYEPVTRVAEELAVLDVVTGGRLIAGLVVGGGPEYYSFGVNPSTARPRFRESLELILKAWTEPGPFEFHGEFTTQRYVNPWPRPYQRPHPEILVPGSGTPETVELVADLGLSYTGLPFFPLAALERSYAQFRQAWIGKGRTNEVGNLGTLLPIYVSETDESARAEYEEHFWYFAKRLLNGVQLSPPGYSGHESRLRALKASQHFLANVTDWDAVLEAGYAYVGSPETVYQRLAEALEKLGASRLMGLFHIGSLPHELTTKNMTLFAEQVMPRLKAEFPNGPTWKES